MKTWWYLYYKPALSSFKRKKVLIDSKWDLYAIIGYIQSHSIESIPRIDYEVCPDVDSDRFKETEEINLNHLKMFSREEWERQVK